MLKIYGEASELVMWLGDGVENDDLSMEVVRRNIERFLSRRGDHITHRAPVDTNLNSIAYDVPCTDLKALVSTKLGGSNSLMVLKKRLN